MKTFVLCCSLLASVTHAVAAERAPSIMSQVGDDAHAIARFAQVSKRGELPRDVMKRIVNEDIDVLRGKRSDGTFLYATYERVEAGRVRDSVSVAANTEEKLSKAELKGEFVYRLMLEVPTRRMLVTKNRRLWLERIDLEYMPQNSSTTKTQTFKVGEWLEPGATKTFDFQEVGRQATARVWARADPAQGYANLDMTLLEARIVDNPDSPYADFMADEKALQRALEHDDVSSIRNVAGRIHETAGLATPESRVTRSIEVIAPRPVEIPREPSVATPAAPELFPELQAIEDLLTGSETEKREGLDRLHQLVRKTRPRS